MIMLALQVIHWRFVAVIVLHNTIILWTAELTDYVIKCWFKTKDTEHGFFLNGLIIEL